MYHTVVNIPYRLLLQQSIADKIRSEHEQQRALTRRDSSSSIQSLTSAEVEEITRTAQTANQRIEELARDTTGIALPTSDGTRNFMNPLGERLVVFFMLCDVISAANVAWMEKHFVKNCAKVS